MSSESGQQEEQELPQLFKEALSLFDIISQSDEPTNSLTVQDKVHKCIQFFEKVTNLVSLVGLFSTNEQIDEIATNDLQYLLLPAFLGTLTLKLTTGERKDIINVAEVYFKDFLKRCSQYNLCDYNTDENKESSSPRLETEIQKIGNAVNVRSNKIQRFKEHKQLKTMLETMKQNLNNEHIDDTVKREYYLTLIKNYIYEAVDELASIDMEKPILEHMSLINKEGKKEIRKPVKPLKPVIITKDAIQKAVYGAGYPSLPTMSVQEFYDQRVRDGVFPDPTKIRSNPGPMSLQEAAISGLNLNDKQDQEDAEQENKIDNDDEAYLNDQRRRDEFKDVNRRGWGNRPFFLRT